MVEGFVKLLYAGLGAISMTRQRAEEIFEDLVARGEAEKEHRSKFVQDLVDTAEKTRGDVKEFVAEQVQKAVAGMNLPTREDLARLEKKLDELAGKK